ncbi:MAG: oxidoreductase [Candidatus Moranbacteria bacterium CG_4_9_14_3_um_filter_42_9]|nr:MAG: oxidoreductase [Candidatus Moranbacteria bacterium CG_4_9_14_3_um_filter_42_9]
MHTLKLLEKKELAEGTMAFYFGKPASFSYLPGQYAFFSIGEKGLFKKKLVRHFTLITIPSEDRLGFATRMRAESDFKNKLKAMPIGSPVDISEPLGSFILPESAGAPLVFLAGGIGITPGYSMLQSAAAAGSAQEITLFYSNRNPKATAFLAELKGLASDKIKIVATMTDDGLSLAEWDGERGRISPELIKKYVASWPEALYYMSGPLEMVKAMKKMLTEMGIKSAQIKIETFTGY